MSRLATAAALHASLVMAQAPAPPTNATATVGGSAITYGPPNYNGTTSSLAIVQTPNPAPFSGTTGYNAIAYDTSLNPAGVDPYLRATDSTMLGGVSPVSTMDGGDGSEVWNCAGRTDTTAACANATLYLTEAASGGCNFVMGLKGRPPDAFQIVAPLPPTSATSSSAGGAAPCGNLAFSNQDPLKGYKLNKSGDPTLYSVTFAWDGTPGHLITSTQTQIADLGALCPLPGGSGANFSLIMQVSHDITDTIFWTAANSGQGTVGYIIKYVTTGPYCVVFDTNAGTTACSGTGCPATGTVVSGCHGIQIHNATTHGDGQWVNVSGASTGVNCGHQDYFWDGTLNDQPCNATVVGGSLLCGGGHEAYGYHKHVIISFPKFYLFAPEVANTGTNIASFGSIPPSGSQGCEDHFSWRNSTAAETQPIFGSDADNNFSLSATTSSWVTPVQNENYILFQNGTVKRLGHNFVLGSGNTPAAGACGTGDAGPFDWLFTAQNAIGVVSQDGRFWMWQSSMLGQLGLDSSSQTRADIFIQRAD